MLIGVTGSMGSGKSSLCRLFAAWGAVWIDADRVAHQILERPEVIARLREAFGDQVLLEDGMLNRGELGRQAFASEHGWQLLTRIVRPPLAAQLGREIEKAVSSGSGLVVVDAPLLFEWGMEKECDAVVVVDAKEALCRARVQARSGLSDAEIRQRMAYQLPASEKKKRADFVVDNNGDAAQLDCQARTVWPLLTRLGNGSAA